MGILDYFRGWDDFVSYASEDAEIAVAVEQLLKGVGQRVYLDKSANQPGRPLEIILDEVRRSTRFVVVMSEHAVASEWVSDELRAYLERPKKKWLLLPIFVDDRYPETLEPPFDVLKRYGGIRWPKRPTALGVVRKQLARDFRASRKATRQRLAAMGAVVTLSLGAFSANQVVTRNRQVATLVHEAELKSRSLRFDEAELALSRAWQISESPEVFQAYQRARAHRILQEPLALQVSQDEAVLAVDGVGDAPYAVVHAGDDLMLVSSGARRKLGVQCGAAPVVVTRRELAVWSCNQTLGAYSVGDAEPRTIALPDEPLALRLSGASVDVLFQREAMAQVGTFALDSLNPIGLQSHPLPAANSKLGFCPHSDAIWSVHAKEGRAVFESWDSKGRALEGGDWPLPDVDIAGWAWIGRVVASDDCQRFFVTYRPSSLDGSLSKALTARYWLGGLKPPERIPDDVRRLLPLPISTGLEAVLLNSDKELRALLLTDAVVRGSKLQTLASGQHAVVAWPHGDARAPDVLAVSDRVLAAYREREPWSHLPTRVTDPSRLRTSPDGEWVLLEGAQAIVWRRAKRSSNAVPPPAEVAADLGLPWRADP